MRCHELSGPEAFVTKMLSRGHNEGTSLTGIMRQRALGHNLYFLSHRITTLLEDLNVHEEDGTESWSLFNQNIIIFLG